MSVGRSIESVRRRLANAAVTQPYAHISMLDGPLGRWLRATYWGARLRSLGRNVTFGVGVRIEGAEWISIGDDTWIDDYVVLLAGPPGAGRRVFAKGNAAYSGEIGALHIGRSCHLAPHVVAQAHGGMWIGDACGVASGAKLYSLSHHYRDLGAPGPSSVVYKFSPRAPLAEQAMVTGPVVLEDATAIGLNTVVLPGSTVRAGTWVGAMSLVQGELAPDSVAAGNPAKVVKRIRGER